jgi:hypothetical protein
MDELMNLGDFSRIADQMPEWNKEISDYLTNLGPVEIEYTDGTKVIFNEDLD